MVLQLKFQMLGFSQIIQHKFPSSACKIFPLDGTALGLAGVQSMIVWMILILTNDGANKVNFRGNKD